MGSQKTSLGKGASGFTLLEVLAVLIILGSTILLSGKVFTNFVQGYVMARSAGAAVQKAQNAMQRLTLDFTYLIVSQSFGTAQTITYATSLAPAQTITVFQKGTTIVYSLGGKDFVLTDGVAPGSLRFTYYTTYNGSAASSFAGTDPISLVGFSFTLGGDDSSVSLSQAYATRVKVGKIL